MRKRNSRTRAAFTLIEILVVIAIIGVLASVIVVKYSTYLKDSKIKTTKLKIMKIGQAIEAYNFTKSKYPESMEEMVSPEEEGAEAILDKTPYDPWKNAIVYSLTEGEDNPFSLKSFGPDKEEDTEDDLDYWTIKTEPEEGEEEE